jgi:hypothetical protein
MEAVQRRDGGELRPSSRVCRVLDRSRDGRLAGAGRPDDPEQVAARRAIDGLEQLLDDSVVGRGTHHARLAAADNVEPLSAEKRP